MPINHNILNIIVSKLAFEQWQNKMKLIIEEYYDKIRYIDWEPTCPTLMYDTGKRVETDNETFKVYHILGFDRKIISRFTGKK